jgi:hypothetical protein
LEPLANPAINRWAIVERSSGTQSISDEVRSEITGPENALKPILGYYHLRRSQERMIHLRKPVLLKKSEVSMDINQATRILQQFSGQDLTTTLAGIESSAKGLTSENCHTALTTWGARNEVLVAAGLVKKLAGQINVIIHASGILMCLPRILEPDEVVQYLSLGAGNTGRPFDLETNKRIGEFKFIRWKGADAIRQNSLFKDFYQLAEYSTSKTKCLYVLGKEHPLKFLNGRRAIVSVLDKYATLLERFRRTYGNQYETVRDYWQARGTQVDLHDVSMWVSGLINEGIDEFEPPRPDA